MIDRDSFCKRYGIESAEIERSGLKWDELVKIAKDLLDRTPELEIAAKSVVGHLEKCHAVHSIRWRVKNPEHLVEKLIRKRRAAPTRLIDLSNYTTEITDLVGVRALHLFKNDWRTIHQEISQTWNLREGHKPIAYVRAGDEKLEGYKELGCDVQEHERAYRSVHYVIQFQPTKTTTIAEIQVRTLFEEGWSEIDHRIAYPNNADDALLTGYLRIFNLLAGASDQMGTYLGHLKTGLDKLREDAEGKDKEAKRAIGELERIQKELGEATKQKEALERVVESLKRSSGNNAITIDTLGDIFRTTSSSSGNVVNLTNLTPSRYSNLFAQSMCASCGYGPLPPKRGLMVTGQCPACGHAY